ncbi:MAG: hypothetical protein NVSMB24_34810 [Mucilaginibacter sp.]
MKKLIFGICIVMSVASCGGNNKSDKNQTQSDSSQAQRKRALTLPITKTLNGFDESKATKMISDFANSFTVDGNRVSTDVGKKSVYTWYSCADIKKIYDLLIDEKAKADGIRIYFGCDPKSPGSTKLKVHLFMVSTKKRTAPPDPIGNGSNHIDYYDHSGPFSTYLNGTSPFGDGVDDDAANGPKNGALLYDKPNTTTAQFPTTPCIDNDNHYIPNDIALKWVQKRGDSHTTTSDPSGYNTRSEWFDYPFIKKLFGIIINNQFSGLRIYLGKGQVDAQGRVRDVLILLPTKKVGGIDKDDYECITGFSNNPFKSAKSIFASDNGELCPDVCN